MIYFTADHHFGHENIIKYCKRPFNSLEEMDNEMIERWNSVVGHSDTVYHLGDFTLGNRSTAREYFKRLNGSINVIPGGHDSRWCETNIFRRVFVFPPIHSVQTGSLGYIVMCHYPMYTWERSHYGSIHLHGHCHGTIGTASWSGDVQLPPNQKNGIRIDVGVDCHDFYPISMNRIKEIIDEYR